MIPRLPSHSSGEESRDSVVSGRLSWIRSGTLWSLTVASFLFLALLALFGCSSPIRLTLTPPTTLPTGEPTVTVTPSVESTSPITQEIPSPDPTPESFEPAATPRLPTLTPVDYAPSPHPATVVTIPILMYHHLKTLGQGPSLALRTWTVSPDNFAAQLDYLMTTGYHTITFGQLLAYFHSGGPLPVHPIILTFDDGSVEHYKVAYPALEARGFVGTFFVPTSYAGAPAFMTWNEIREMDSAGMEIGGHTLNHADLKRSLPDEALRQLTVSKQTMERALGHPTLVFAYPFGAFDGRVIEEVRAVGYQAAVTLCCGYRLRADTLLMLPRIRVSYDDNLEQFKSRLPIQGNPRAIKGRIPE